MKKWWGYLLLSIVVVVGVLFYIEIYNPPLPIKSVSKEEVMDKAGKSSGDVVKMAEEDGYQWYIAEKKEGKTFNSLKKIMKEKGWSFKEQRESYFIFQGTKGEMTVRSKEWKKKYIIFYFPSGI